MTKSRVLSALFVVLVATVAFAQSPAATRSVVLELSLPNGATPQLRIADGGTGTVDLPSVGKFGFVPKIQHDASSVVVVDVFDLTPTPHARLGSVEAVVGGDRVDSDTTPRIGVRALRVVTP